MRRSGGLGFSASCGKDEIHGNEWRTEVEVKGFGSDDVTVLVNGNNLDINCVHDEGGSRRQSRKQIQVPNGADTSKIETEVTDAGVLVIKAPYEAPQGNDNNNDFSFGGFSKMGMQSKMREFDSTDSQKDFLTKVVLRNFKPSEIKIKAGGGRIKVNARSQQGVSTRLVDRAFDLPQKVDMAVLAAILTEDGTMYIGAPIPGDIKGETVEITKE